MSSGELRIGVIGTGFIAQAMIDGFLLRGEEGLSVTVSPRGAATAATLAARYPRTVRIAASNQAVLDASDLIICAVRPQAAEAVLGALRFVARHHVVSVIAAFSREDIRRLTDPAGGVTLAIPLPAMARGNSATVIMPGNERVAALFQRGGAVIAVDDAHAYAALGTSTAIMAPYFAVARTVSDWLAANGVAATPARQYVASLLQGLAETTAGDADKDFARLETDHATPGSFNDQLRRHLADGGAFRAFETGLDILLRRMLGKD